MNCFNSKQKKKPEKLKISKAEEAGKKHRADKSNQKKKIEYKQYPTKKENLLLIKFRALVFFFLFFLSKIYLFHSHPFHLFWLLFKRKRKKKAKQSKKKF